ncbi:MAG TPA: hypothetical protein VFC31_10675 [Candidatus Limnocylindria bacterium]|nr:hypothetical protein [Candidatus Limnocylindria bacterium]
MPRPLEGLLTLAATALGIAFFLSVPYWPRAWTERALPVASVSRLPRGPSVLASLRPAPLLNLTFPDDVATVVARRGINGETGLIPTAASITTFRLRATGDLVSVAAPTGVDPVRPVSSDAHPALRVHGAYAVVATDDRGITTIRWTENGVTYEISSRTLDATHLADVANGLR